MAGVIRHSPREPVPQKTVEQDGFDVKMIAELGIKAKHFIGPGQNSGQHLYNAPQCDKRFGGNPSTTDNYELIPAINGDSLSIRAKYSFEKIDILIYRGQNSSGNNRDVLYIINDFILLQKNNVNNLSTNGNPAIGQRFEHELWLKWPIYERICVFTDPYWQPYLRFYRIENRKILFFIGTHYSDDSVKSSGFGIFKLPALDQKLFHPQTRGGIKTNINFEAQVVDWKFNPRRIDKDIIVYQDAKIETSDNGSRHYRPVGGKHYYYDIRSNITRELPVQFVKWQYKTGQYFPPNGSRPSEDNLGPEENNIFIAQDNNLNAFAYKFIRGGNHITACQECGKALSRDKPYMIHVPCDHKVCEGCQATPAPGVGPVGIGQKCHCQCGAQVTHVARNDPI